MRWAQSSRERPPIYHEGLKREETRLNAKELSQSTKGLRYQLENSRSDKERTTGTIQGSELEVASTR